MSERQNIIFLDIDGPMIPSYMYIEKIDCSMSMEGRLFSKYSVMMINKICEEANAKVVFNTYHNRHLPTKVGYINDDAIANGVNRDFIHDDWKTQYPVMHNRHEAIQLWIKEHGGDDAVNWIAIDDADFTDRAGEKLILIDADRGIGLPEYNKAAELLGFKPFIVLI